MIGEESIFLQALFLKLNKDYPVGIGDFKWQNSIFDMGLWAARRR